MNFEFKKGHQEGAFFNPDYNGICYAPLYIFCGHHLLVAKLRPSQKISPSQVYTEKYCLRGEMENRIKEQQLD